MATMQPQNNFTIFVWANWEMSSCANALFIGLKKINFRRNQFSPDNG